MPMIEFNEKDLLRNKIVKPAWYRVRVDDIIEKAAKAPSTNTNYWVEGEILFNSENGDKEFAGVPTPFAWLFTTGAMGFAYGFIAAIMGKEPELGKRYELSHAIGKELDVFIENDIYNGQVQNKVNHKYRPARSNQEVS